MSRGCNKRHDGRSTKQSERPKTTGGWGLADGFEPTEPSSSLVFPLPFPPNLSDTLWLAGWQKGEGLSFGRGKNYSYSEHERSRLSGEDTHESKLNLRALAAATRLRHSGCRSGSKGD